MRALLLYTVSVLILVLTSGIHGRVANFPKTFGEFPRFDNTQFDDDGLEPGEMLFGDMILTQDQVQDKLLYSANEGNEWAGMEIWVKEAAKKWPNGIVPYKKDSTLTADMSKAVDDALREYHAKVCVEFIKRTTQTDYVVFKKGTTCQSHLGRKGGIQSITLSDNCRDKMVVMHEIMHALGREHEHQRYDRDKYVTVNWSNIKGGTTNTAFKKFAKNAFNTQGFSYDIYSIMHYPSWTHVIRSGLACMTPKDSTVPLSSMGAQHTATGTFSANDVLHINTFYNCKHLLPGR